MPLQLSQNKKSLIRKTTENFEQILKIILKKVQFTLFINYFNFKVKSYFTYQIYQVNVCHLY